MNSIWILYDGECQFCLRMISLLKKFLKDKNFEFAPLQTPWVQQRLRLSPEQFNQGIRVLINDNVGLIGLEAVLYLARLRWFTWPIFALSKVPAIKPVMAVIYRWIAKNRLRISRLLPPLTILWVTIKLSEGI